MRYHFLLDLRYPRPRLLPGAVLERDLAALDAVDVDAAAVDGAAVAGLAGGAEGADDAVAVDGYRGLGETPFGNDAQEWRCEEDNWDEMRCDVTGRYSSCSLQHRRPVGKKMCLPCRRHNRLI